MTAGPDTNTSTIRRWQLALLLAYPLLAVAGALTHRQIFPLAALLLLLTALLLPQLRRGLLCHARFHTLAALPPPGGSRRGV